MPEILSPFTRGGMCANPFGGEDCINRIDLLDLMGADDDPEKILYCCVIQDAASNYLYAFLGKNGTSAEEFFAAWQYFFKVKSSDRASWDHHRNIKHIYNRRGKRVVESHYLTDSELELMCFDKQYEMSGLAEYLHIDRFRSQLKEKREKILKNNWDQVVAYVKALYDRELSELAYGQQVPLRIWEADLLPLLIDPVKPEQLAHAIYIPSRLKRSRKARVKKAGDGKYIELVRKISKRQVESLPSNWGPLCPA